MSINKILRMPPIRAKKWRATLPKHYGNMGGHVAIGMGDIWKGKEGQYLKFQQSGARQNNCSIIPTGDRLRSGPLHCYTHEKTFDRGERCPGAGTYNVKRHILPFWWRVGDRLKTMLKGKFNGPITNEA